MAKPVGTKNVSAAEGARLADLADQGLSRTEAAKAMGRSIWTVKRHSLELGIAFAQRERRPGVAKSEASQRLAEARARRRQLEDRVIHELARSGWSQGLAAIELDLDVSALSRHSKRLGVTWIRYPKRSMRGSSVSGLVELQILRAQIANSAAD